MSAAEPLSVALDAGGPLRVEWDPLALRELAEGSEPAGAVWRLDGSLDGELRVISAALQDGTLLGVAALRPEGAEGHDADQVRAFLLRPEAEPVAASEVRLSTEYDAEGLPRRVGVELFTDGDAPPLRAAGDRRDEASAESGSGAWIAMEFRAEGHSGSGRYELRRG